MAHLLGLRVQNFKSLADFTLGQIGYGHGQALPPVMCFIGPNGCGKSSLLDAFAFMADCLLEGVEAACDKPHRGGFWRLRTQGKQEPIKFELYFRQTGIARPITYAFEIDERDGVPIVVSERLRQRRSGQKWGQPFSFVDLKMGMGTVWSGQLYHKLVEQLAREFRQHAEKSGAKIQLLVTTHSPYFVDALAPNQVWLLGKNEHGHTQARRTSDMPAIRELEAEGLPLGSLWYSNHFEERFPL